MAQKSNIRSMRFSDTMIEMIESQAGETFTAKFEALVTRCMWELPRKEELKSIQKRINQERERLDRITNKAYEMENKLANISYTADQYNRQLKWATEQLKGMFEEA